MSTATEPAPVYIVAPEMTAAPLIPDGTCNLCGHERPARTLVRVVTHTGDEMSICRVCQRQIESAFNRMWF